jgi:hypothetical protein
MKNYYFLALTFLLSACDFPKSVPDAITSLNGVYQIDLTALILNSDNTFALGSYPVVQTCGSYYVRKSPIPSQRRVIETEDSLKGTYYIKDNNFCFDKIYRVVKILIHDYEHDALYQMAYTDAENRYKFQKEMNRIAEEAMVEERKKNKNNNKVRFTFPKSIPYSYTIPAQFYYPQPSETYISSHYDTIYYKSIKDIARDLESRYPLSILKNLERNLIYSDYLDTTINIPLNFTKDRFIKAIEKSAVQLNNTDAQIGFAYYINESGKVDSLKMTECKNCSDDFRNKSLQILKQVKDWPKGTFFSKPVGYFYFGDVELKK